MLPNHDRQGEAAGAAVERMMQGIFVGHHERTGAALFLSLAQENGTRVQRKPADEHWDYADVKKCRGIPWKLKGEELAPAASPEATVAVPRIGMALGPRWRYILKQDVVKYGITDGCTACAQGNGGLATKVPT
eukprot:3893890-Amphidinium_carterae.2